LNMQKEMLFYNASRIGVSTNRDTTMYLTCGIPCSNCGRAIINAGITEVYCKVEDTTQNRKNGMRNLQKQNKCLRNQV
jgi:deoxycytidylate deaminase